MKRLFMMMNVAGCIFCSMAAVKVSETFGYDPIDSTRFLQAALDSSHTEIIVDVQGGDWVTLPLVGKSNKTIIFEDGAWIRAKRGEFKGLYDILIRFGNCTNVTIRGGGNPRNCGFRMWRDDYDDKSRYQHSEWRHALAFFGCVDVKIDGISANESGGDGLYVTSGNGYYETSSVVKALGRNRGCYNVMVRNCIFDKNYRQGISVIGVDGFVVEDTELTNTKGTPPQAGIDFEPNHKDQVLRGIVMRRCLILGNEGNGIDIAHCNSGAASEPVDMLFEDITVVSNTIGVLYGNGIHDQDEYSDCGEVTIRNCKFSNMRKYGVKIQKHCNSGGRVTFENCMFDNCWTATDSGDAEMWLSVMGHDQGEPDMVVFRNVTINQQRERPIILCHPKRSIPWRGRPTIIDGDITRIIADKETVFRYNATWRKDNFPFRDMRLLSPPPRVLAPLDGAVVMDSAPNEMRPCSALFVRYEGRYAFYVAKNGPVRFRFLQTLIGKNYKVRPITIKRHGGDKILATLDSPCASEGGEVVFDAPEPGFYTLTFWTSDGMALVGSTVPVALDATCDSVFLVGPCKMPDRRKYLNARNRMWICVGAEKRFEFCAMSDGFETLGFEVFDPDGKSVARIGSVDGVERVQPESREGLWAMDTLKPEVGAYEDHSISVRGVPGWLFVSEGRYWKTKVK